MLREHVRRGRLRLAAKAEQLRHLFERGASRPGRNEAGRQQRRDDN